MSTTLTQLATNLKIKTVKASDAFNELFDAVVELEKQAANFAPTTVFNELLVKVSALVNANMGTPEGAAASPLTPKVKKTLRRSANDAVYVKAVVNTRLTTGKTFGEIADALGGSPWLVRSICSKAGIKTSRNRFTPEQEDTILSKATSVNYSFADIAKEYGVTPSIIKQTVNRLINKTQSVSPVGGIQLGTLSNS